MGNAIGYRRLSERDQSKYSLEYQEKAIGDYCTRNNLDLIGLYTDNGQCSDTFDRPDYRALESFLRKNKGKAEYLIIMDHDRFSRNLPEALMKIDELQNRFRIKVLATNEDVNLDTQDPAVFMQRAFSYLMANQELFRIRKRTRDGIRQAQMSGRHVNRAPFGYINAKDKDDRGILLVDENKAEIVQEIYKKYIAGLSVHEIHSWARKQGFNNEGNSAIPRLLSRAVYAGLVKVTATRSQPEKYVKGLHQPLVSESDYWRVQEKLGNKRNARSQPKEEFPLRGVLQCWCGKSMTAGFSKGKSKYYLYYRCTRHTETNYRGDKLHGELEDLLELLSFDKAQVLRISKDAKTFIERSLIDNRKIIASREKQIEEVDRKIEKLEEKLMNDEVDGQTFKKLKIKLHSEKNLLIESRKELQSGNAEHKLRRLDEIMPELTSLKSIYQISNLKRKQSLIRGVFKHKLTYSDGAFRTPKIDETFSPNSLKAKEKGLLVEEQPDDVWGKIPFCSP